MTTTNPHPDPAQPRRRRRRRRPVLGIVLLVVALLLVIPGVSYARALTYPGSASWQMRSVEWIRDHGGSPLINAIEVWRYTHNQPARTGAPTEPLPRVRAGSGASRPALVHPAALPTLADAPILPGEATWVPGSRTIGDQPPLYTAFFRPDPAHTSVVVGVAWMDQHLTHAHLIAGTREPGGAGWPDGYQVPPQMRSSLIAAFNSGFKLKDAHGGSYAHGRPTRPLREGAASLVIDKRGTVSIGQWGRDGGMSPNVAAVRQNLHLIVDHAASVPGLDRNAHGTWGSLKSQLEYTWRSGVGTDRHGDLIYVAGNGLTLTTLAQAMVKAGIVQGMQLDIHTNMVTFNTYRPAPNQAGGLLAAKLLPSMTRPATRYLQPDQRDFIAITTR